MARSDELIHAINAAFVEVPYPCGHAISEDTQDDEGTTAHFRGTSWRDHSPEALSRQSFALLIFTPEAFRYFLPSFLVASLRAPRIAPLDSVIYALTPPKGNPRRPSFWRRWSLFTPAQRRVIVDCLRYWEELGYSYSAVTSSLESTVDA
jgi:Family of unknown function (DUF6714)